jgi:hypothetical protein
MFTAQNRDVFTTINKGFTASKAAATLPATGNQTIFTVSTGRCLVGLLLGQVTTVCDATATTIKITSVPTVGSAVDVTATLAITSFEAGAILVVEGDGTAIIGTSTGSGFAPALTLVPWVVPAGILRLTTSATNAGATKWDIWYLPLDSGASIS